MDIPGITESKYYIMDPDSDALSKTCNLKNGMIVLIYDADRRVDPRKKITDAWETDRLLENNQWCKVTNLEFDRYNLNFGFIGVYADGTQRVRKTAGNQVWIVRRNSLQARDELADKVFDKLMNIQRLQDADTYHQRSSQGTKDRALDLTKEIMAMFGMGETK